MIKDLKENIVVRKIVERDYNSDSLILGNVSPLLMANIEKKLMTGIGQNIALINLLDENMKDADSLDNESIIFEYFWGFVYQYIYFNPELRKKYVDSELEEKILFFNSIIKNKLNPSILMEKRLLFSYEPSAIVRTRGEGDFKICILNYQDVSSLKLAQYINLLTRERPQLTILTQEQGLKTNSTGGFYTSVDQDFAYYDVGGNGKGSFKLEKLKGK